MDTTNWILSIGLVMTTILQYYSPKNNQPNNTNGLLVNFGGNSYLFLAAAKMGLFKWDY